MELVHRCSDTGLQVMLIRGLGSERDCAEGEVLEAGLPLALSHRAVWAAHVGRWEPVFMLVHDEAGRACGGFAIEEVRTRAMPGHVILRVGRFGGNLSDEVCRVALQAMIKLAKSSPRVLRIQVNVFSRDRRVAIGNLLEELGFREIQPPSSYRNTLVIDLRPTEDEIFASLGKSARKRIRQTAKMSLQSVAISDPVYAERLKELQQAAFKRTGGHIISEDWRGILKMSHDHPNLSRVIGSFPSEVTAPSNMAAFGWVCNHGDHAEYRSAGSTKQSGQVPFGSLVLWEMIRWAKSTGAQWFDMGGVTLGEGDDSALEGISQFKMYFSHEVVEVGAEWVFEPAPVRARIGDFVSNSASRIRTWIKRG